MPLRHCEQVRCLVGRQLCRPAGGTHDSPKTHIGCSAPWQPVICLVPMSLLARCFSPVPLPPHAPPPPPPHLSQTQVLRRQLAAGMLRFHPTAITARQRRQ